VDEVRRKNPDRLGFPLCLLPEFLRQKIAAKSETRQVRSPFVDMSMFGAILQEGQLNELTKWNRQDAPGTVKFEARKNE